MNLRKNLDTTMGEPDERRPRTDQRCRHRSLDDGACRGVG